VRVPRRTRAGDPPVVLDLETTGLNRWNTIVSAGLLVEQTAYILFAHSLHVSIRNLPDAAFREALGGLERPNLVIVGHNLGFDLAFLRREGIRVTGEVRDTLRLLQLLDQDRGRDATERRKPRIDLRAPTGSPYLLNYRLKNVVPQLLGYRMTEFPGAMDLAPYQVHTRYLACDLLGTWKLHEYLWPRLGHGLQSYYCRMVAPLTLLLVEMSYRGVQSDPDFIVNESSRLEALLARISQEHHARHGVPLGMDADGLTAWLFGRRNLGLDPRRWSRRGGWRVPRLDAKAIDQLLDAAAAAGRTEAQSSLHLIRDYRRAASLLVRLRSLLKHIDPRTATIHSTFGDIQATGRISSQRPNLQQLAKARTIAGEVIASRNAIVASSGCELVVFDIKQADMRVLAHAVESCLLTTRECLHALSRQRWLALRGDIEPYLRRLGDCLNPDYEGAAEPWPDFDPGATSNLAEDFRMPGDLYMKAVERLLGRAPSTEERKFYKQVILAIVNGQGAQSLAESLKCKREQASGYLSAFNRAYPKEAAFKELMYQVIACTGEMATFLGRPRAVTPHKWMATEPLVEILVSYRRGDAYWLEIVPLRPGRRVLTSYVLRAWNARTSPRRLIYDHRRGRLSDKSYRLFETHDLVYRLPCRNWAWRSIRRVRHPGKGEEAHYEGFDATARSLFNHLCQGGTADIAKLMMLRSQPLCERFGARLLIQIHDELVFEVPKDRATAFIEAVQSELERPPARDFRVPVQVEVKRGLRFGDVK
jgi:DNA polymerase I-like protein with 3'-5' exonuclease and polymerase domains